MKFPDFPNIPYNMSFIQIMCIFLGRGIADLKKSRTFALPLKNGYAEKVKVLEKTGARIKFQKFYEKIWKFKNNAYLCSPVRKTGPRKRQKKFIEKTDLLYKKQVPRKYNLSRSVNSFGEL